MPFSKKPDNKLVLMLSVQSSIVSGSLAVFGSDNLPRIIYSHNNNIVFDPNLGDDVLIKATLRAISLTIQAAQLFIHAHKNAGKNPAIPHKISSVHYVLSSPWIVSDAKALSMTFDKNTEINQKFILELINKERSKIASSPIRPIQVIEQKIFDVRLNGYSVNDWEHRTAKSLDVSFTVSVAGTNMVDCFIDQCKHLVHADKVHFHSSLLLQYIGIEKAIKMGSNYFLVQIHGDRTDIFIVRQKTCVFSGSFPFGIRTVLNRVKLATNNTGQAVDSLISLYSSGTLEDSHNKKTIDVVGKVMAEWAHDLSALLVESKVEINESFSVILNTASYGECFLKILALNNPQKQVSRLAVDDLLPFISFEEQSEKSELTALHGIAIHSLLL